MPQKCGVLFLWKSSMQPKRRIQNAILLFRNGNVRICREVEIWYCGSVSYHGAKVLLPCGSLSARNHLSLEYAMPKRHAIRLIKRCFDVKKIPCEIITIYAITKEKTLD